MQAYVDEALGWLPRPHSDELAGVGSIAASEDVEAVFRGHGERVVLADDNADMRDYVRRLLESGGYEVEACVDGVAALKAIRARVPDLVLSDVMMPNLDGFALLDAIRRDTDLRAVPVLLLSARAGEEARVEGLHAGADDYLTKPFSARELLARVGSTLHSARLRRETERAAARRGAHARHRQSRRRDDRGRARSRSHGADGHRRGDRADRRGSSAHSSTTWSTAAARATCYTRSRAFRARRSTSSRCRATRRYSSRRSAARRRALATTSLLDPRYGKNAPHYGMPDGHLPVRSYLAVPVISAQRRSARRTVLRSRPSRGIHRACRAAWWAIAAQAAVAIDNARLYRASQRELAGGA